MVIDGVSARMIMAGTSGDRWEDVASDIVRKKKKKKRRADGELGKWDGWMREESLGFTIEKGGQ